MLYKICNNCRAVLVTREVVIPDGTLEVQFDTLDTGYTAIFENDGHTFYRKISDGSCEIGVTQLVTGPVKLKVIKDDEAQPSYLCDELYVTRRGDVCAVSGNTLEYDTLLTELRCENDELREGMAAFEKELLQFREDFNRIYKGYSII